jgi:3-phenylpropionate/trans-cinnamate dioxygenase ferredoxin subunit
MSGRLIWVAERWLPVCAAGRFAAGDVIPVRVAGVDLVLAPYRGGVVACERACPHEQADLADGRIKDGRLFCPRHAASFSLDDGAISSGWPSRPLRLYPARVEQGEVLIDAAVLTRAGKD